MHHFVLYIEFSLRYLFDETTCIPCYVCLVSLKKLLEVTSAGAIHNIETKQIVEI